MNVAKYLSIVTAGVALVALGVIDKVQAASISSGTSVSGTINSTITIANPVLLDIGTDPSTQMTFEDVALLSNEIKPNNTFSFQNINLPAGSQYVTVLGVYNHSTVNPDSDNSVEGIAALLKSTAKGKSFDDVTGAQNEQSVVNTINNIVQKAAKYGFQKDVVYNPAKYGYSLGIPSTVIQYLPSSNESADLVGFSNGKSLGNGSLTTLPINAVPEPSSTPSTLALGALGVGYVLKRKFKKQNYLCATGIMKRLKP